MDENKKKDELIPDIEEDINEDASTNAEEVADEDNNESVEDRAAKILSGLKASSLPDAVQDWDGVLPENKNEVEIIEDEVHIIDEIKEAEEEEEIPEEELCVICGKRRRCTSISEDYEYCAQCRIKMLKRPYNGMGIATVAIVFILFFVITVIGLFATNSGFLPNLLIAKEVGDAMMAEKNGSVAIAVEEYDKALQDAKNLDMGTSLELVRKAAILTERLEGPESAKAVIKNAIGTEAAKEDEVLSGILTRAEIFTTTTTDCMNEFQSLFDAVTGDLDVDAAYAAMDKMLKENQGQYDVDIIVYYKSVVAAFEKDTKKEIKFREEVKNNSPEKAWLYNYGNVLVDGYMKLGEYDKAMKMADDILKLNRTNTEVNWSKAKYAIMNNNEAEIKKIVDLLKENESTKAMAKAIEALKLRLDGEYDKVAEMCTDAIDGDAYNAELYYQNAVAMVLRGDAETVASMMNDYMSFVQYSNLSQSDNEKCFYMYVLVTYLTDKEAYKTLEEEQLKNADGTLAVPDEFIKFKEGKITLEDIFLKGDYELI